MAKPRELKWMPAAQKAYDDLRSEAENSLQVRTEKGRKKSSKAESLFKKVHKTVTLLRTNTKHPSLKTHEYQSIENPYDQKQKVFEAYAQNQTPGAYRVFWCYGPGKADITILAITPHP